jgi:hypothetical protein
VVWKYYCEFLELQIEYLQNMSEHYIYQHENGTIDSNDMLPEYSQLSEITSSTEKQIQQLKQ